MVDHQDQYSQLLMFQLSQMLTCSNSVNLAQLAQSKLTKLPQTLLTKEEMNFQLQLEVFLVYSLDSHQEQNLISLLMMVMLEELLRLYKLLLLTIQSHAELKLLIF
jgi:hypothetical protein